MTRSQLEHVIRAAGTIADTEHVIIIGSQSILGQFPDAPEEFRQSDEADLYPRDDPSRADLIEGSIGELSPFHDTFGYYVQAVGPDTASLPVGWESRLIPVASQATRGITGWCLEVHDLALAKYAAGREKDQVFTAALVRHAMVDESTLRERLETMVLDPRVRSLVEARIGRDFG